MNARLQAFIQGVSDYSTKASSPRMASLLATRVSGALGNVFEGIFITSSAMTDAQGAVPASIRAAMRDLLAKGTYWIIVNDARLASAALEGGFVVDWPVDLNAEVRLLAASERIREYVDANGYHMEKILGVATLHRDNNAIADLMGAIRLPASFVVDFQPTDVDIASIVLLPAVAGGALQKSTAAVEGVLDSVVFARRINMRETAAVVAQGTIVNDLGAAAKVAAHNFEKACGRLFTEYQHLKHAEIYDHHSGAVAFRPLDWAYLRDLETWGEASPVVDYFGEKSHTYWQPGRPCLKRILYTPTKVLLRGEQYYFHMKNISPMDRVREVTRELDTLIELHDAFEALAAVDCCGVTGRWKLALAFLDQLRNIGLQFFSFVHAADVMLASAIELADADAETSGLLDQVRATFDESGKLHSFVMRVVAAYYYWLLLETDGARDLLKKSFGYANQVLPHIRDLVPKLESWLEKRSVDGKPVVQIERLVRRWREADHPGENLLVVLSALEDVKTAGAVDAVGVGWGGIELPVIFRYLAFLRRVPAANAERVNTYVANWSHYGASERQPEWVSFPRPEAGGPTFSGSVSLLLDDNVLTGSTLERIREQMLLNSARDVRIYVTRFSGERRLAHMQMKEHGVVDPQVLLNEIHGYIGETPFARSWSTKKGDYANQIGVFSLARRRILECIHNNSTVEAWDREGF